MTDFLHRLLKATAVPILILFFITLWLVYFRYPTINYQNSVSTEALSEVIEIMGKPKAKIDFFEKNTKYYFPKDAYTPEYISWGKLLVNIESYEQRTFNSRGGSYSEFFLHSLYSEDGGRTWIELSEGGEAACGKGIVIGGKYICLTYQYNSNTLAKVYTTQNNYKILKLPSGIYQHLEAMYFENSLWFVWQDSRAKWKTIDYYFPTVEAEPRPGYAGPSLIMAGKLNLDTLEFEEYVIKYDSAEFP